MRTKLHRHNFDGTVGYVAGGAQGFKHFERLIRLRNQVEEPWVQWKAFCPKYNQLAPAHKMSQVCHRLHILTMCHYFGSFTYCQDFMLHLQHMPPVTRAVRLCLLQFHNLCHKSSSAVIVQQIVLPYCLQVQDIPFSGQTATHRSSF